MRRGILAAAVIIALAATEVRGAISTVAVPSTTTLGANQLRNDLLGPGITVIGNASGTGSGLSSGEFTGGLSAGIGIDQGIVLSTGPVSNITAVNTADNIQGIASGAGDPDISGSTDTTSLIFQFQFGDGSVGGDLHFNYVFASDEYDEFVGSQFNDEFRFLLDGVNVALIPSTTTPVSINTVNAGTNSTYFNDNDPVSRPSTTPYPFEFDGFTDVLSVNALGLSAGVHTIKLVISDRGDQIFDSAVFIQGGTFSTQVIPPGEVPEPTTIVMYGLGALGLLVTRRRAPGRRA